MARRCDLRLAPACSAVVSTTVIETARLVLREPTKADAPFVLALLTDPDWILHIGDRGVHSLADARAYIAAGPQAMRRDHGVGLLVVEHGGVPAGLCGLLRRDGHADVDLGYALLPAHRGVGIASEAGRAVLDHARDALGIGRVAAYVSSGNDASVRVLAALGFAFEGVVRLGDVDAHLYAAAL